MMKKFFFAAVCVVLTACEQPSSVRDNFHVNWPPTPTTPQVPELQYYDVKLQERTCPACNGSGFYTDPYGNSDGSPICPRCKGEGKFRVY